MQNYLKSLIHYLTLLCVAISITIMFLGMRAVMDIGGFCAEGGPYEIAVHCPKGIPLMMPLSIFGMLIFGALYFFTGKKDEPNFAFLFWTALFGTLGWNFLEYALYPSDGSGLVISWLICGIMFELMAFGPLLFLFNKDIFFTITKAGNGNNNFLLILLLSFSFAAAGIYSGILIFNYFSA